MMRIQSKLSIFVMSLALVGVPTASTIAAAAAMKQNQTTLEMLIHLQKLIDEFKEKVAEMDEEMRTVRLENTLLKNKINELTSTSSSATAKSSPSRRGFFGYGADEF
jgi:regulator of replication initiation timing